MLSRWEGAHRARLLEYGSWQHAALQRASRLDRGSAPDPTLGTLAQPYAHFPFLPTHAQPADLAFTNAGRTAAAEAADAARRAVEREARQREQRRKVAVAALESGTGAEKQAVESEGGSEAAEGDVLFATTAGYARREMAVRWPAGSGYLSLGKGMPDGVAALAESTEVGVGQLSDLSPQPSACSLAASAASAARRAQPRLVRAPMERRKAGSYTPTNIGSPKPAAARSVPSIGAGGAGLGEAAESGGGVGWGEEDGRSDAGRSAASSRASSVRFASHSVLSLPQPALRANMTKESVLASPLPGTAPAVLSAESEMVLRTLERTGRVGEAVALLAAAIRTGREQRMAAAATQLARAELHSPHSSAQAGSTPGLGGGSPAATARSAFGSPLAGVASAQLGLAPAAGGAPAGGASPTNLGWTSVVRARPLPEPRRTASTWLAGMRDIAPRGGAEASAFGAALPSEARSRWADGYDGPHAGPDAKDGFGRGIGLHAASPPVWQQLASPLRAASGDRPAQPPGVGGLASVLHKQGITSESRLRVLANPVLPRDVLRAGDLLATLRDRTLVSAMGACVLGLVICLLTALLAPYA